MTSLDGRVRSGPDGSDDAPAAEDPDRTVRAAPGGGERADEPAAGPGEAATVRRARPRRSEPEGGPAEPGPDVVPPPDAPPPPPEARQETAAPPRRPVPPTFPSPGQPPPGVARRAGRHARPEAAPSSAPPHTPPDGYRPRHAAPDAETERLPVVTATGPGGTGPAAMPRVESAPPLAAVPAVPDDDPDAPVPTPATGMRAPVLSGPAATGVPAPGELETSGSGRVRIVLAERRAPTRAVRTVAEIEQQTETGELLLGNLLRAQLTLGLRLGVVAVLLLGGLPVLFLALPDLGGVSVLGVRLPWLLLGVVPYPVMLLLGWLYTRTAERNELDFADNVED